jgi:hypothetical protein
MLLGIKALLAVLLLHNSLSYLGPSLLEGYLYNDFAHFYISSKRFFAGLPVYGVRLEPDLLGAGFINEPYIDVATNPPALLTIFGPFLLLTPVVSFWCWTLAASTPS